MCGVFERCKQGSYDEQGGSLQQAQILRHPGLQQALRYFDTGRVVRQGGLRLRHPPACVLVCGVLVCGVRWAHDRGLIAGLCAVCGVRRSHPGRGLLAHTHSTRAHLVNAYDRASLSLARCFGRPANAYDRGLGAQLKLTRVRRLCIARRPVGLLHKPFRRLARVFDTP